MKTVDDDEQDDDDDDLRVGVIHGLAWILTEMEDTFKGNRDL